MKLIQLATGLAMAIAVTGAPDASAQDGITVGGLGCGLDATEVSGSPGLYTGTLHGGPVYGGTVNRPVTSSYLFCTVQVNAPTHDGPDTATVMSWSYGSTAVAPTPVTYHAAPGDVVAVCSEFWFDTDDGHITLFLTSDGEIVLEPTAECEAATVSPVSTACELLGDIANCPNSSSTSTSESVHVHVPWAGVRDVALR